MRSSARSMRSPPSCPRGEARPVAGRPALGHEHHRPAPAVPRCRPRNFQECIMNQPKTSYVLGSSDQEIERLDRQSASIDAATRLLLRAAGITPGMRVLDLGTGIGHVAMLLADLVGPQGSVVAIDSNARLLEVAASRASARPQLRFMEGDVRSWR